MSICSFIVTLLSKLVGLLSPEPYDSRASILEHHYDLSGLGYNFCFFFPLFTVSTLTSSAPGGDGKKGDNDNSSTIVIVAASLAAVFFVVLIVLVVILLLRRRKQHGHGKGECLSRVTFV